MRLLKTSVNSDGTLQSHQFYARRPTYAILSHTWLADDAQELTLQDVLNGDGMSKQGYNKVINAINLAKNNGHEWIWIDTCCIDKTSSVELSEAINSMFRYYAQAHMCYAYLADVEAETAAFSLAHSRWFTRGWTLQELLAPQLLEFISKEWQPLGSKHEHSAAISRNTGIGEEYLTGKSSILHASIASRMFWASRREVTRAEDIAYCLIGVFNVNMYMLYGEGAYKAFLRLQEEILKISDDQSIFAWTKPLYPGDAPHGLLADHPKDFGEASQIVPYTNDPENMIPPTMTARGLHLSLPLGSERPQHVLATLNCPDSHRNYEDYLAVCLLRTGPRTFTRVKCAELFTRPSWKDPKPLFVSQHVYTTRLFNVYPKHVCKLGSVRIRPALCESSVARRQPVEQSQSSAYGAYGFVVHKGVASSSMMSYWLDHIALDSLRDEGNALGDHSIVKKAGTLSMALPFIRAYDDHRFVLLVGSMTDFEIGLDVSFVDPPEMLQGWFITEWNAFWQPLFHPQPLSTPLPVENPILYATADERVDGDTLRFSIDVWIDQPPAFQSRTMSPYLASYRRQLSTP